MLLSGRELINTLHSLLKMHQGTKVQKAINLGYVTVNGELIKSNYIVKPG